MYFIVLLLKQVTKNMVYSVHIMNPTTCKIDHTNQTNETQIYDGDWRVVTKHST